jgi:hypothetical protein
MSKSVEKESGSHPLLDDGCLFLFQLRSHFLFYANSSSNALASLSSFVSNPSVNQP